MPIITKMFTDKGKYNEMKHDYPVDFFIFMHLLVIQQIVIEYLLCVRHYPRLWAYAVEQNRMAFICLVLNLQFILITSSFRKTLAFIRRS